MRIVLIASVLAFSGCVSGKVYKRDVGDLRAKVSVLEAQVKEKDDAIKVYEKIYRETRQIYEKVEKRAKRGKDK